MSRTMERVITEGLDSGELGAVLICPAGHKYEPLSMCLIATTGALETVISVVFDTLGRPIGGSVPQTEWPAGNTLVLVNTVVGILLPGDVFYVIVMNSGCTYNAVMTFIDVDYSD